MEQVLYSGEGGRWQLLEQGAPADLEQGGAPAGPGLLELCRQVSWSWSSVGRGAGEGVEDWGARVAVEPWR
jgi:hypothetical protein